MADSLEMVIAAGATPSNLSLPELEQVIERGQKTFIEVGRALMEIRDRRMYRETHATFEAYCGERWGWTRDYADKHIDAVHVNDALPTTVGKPTNEAQARAMLANLQPEEREQVRSGTATAQVVEKMVTATPDHQKWQGDKGVLINTGESDWLSPLHIVDAANETLGGIDLDPCASLSHIDNVPARIKWTVSDDGLSRDWSGSVYMNPPYGRPIGDWTAKLVSESKSGRVSAFVALVPARTDTRWFADFDGCVYCFIRGRLSFGNLDQGAPFPSVAVYHGNDPGGFALAFSPHGLILSGWSYD